MPRPDPRAPGLGQSELFEASPQVKPGCITRGRHSEAVDGALTSARSAELVAPIDEALATLVRSAAWALDEFERSGKPYGPAKLIDPTVAALRELRMTPDARQTDTDDRIKDLLNDLANADTDTEVSHAEDTRSA